MAAEWKRFEGRQALGRLMHGEDVVVGVPDVGLTTTTFGVEAVKNFQDEYFLDWHGRFYAGPNANKNFQVTKFDKETEPGLLAAVFTITPAVTAIVARDLFELYQDYSPSEMNDAINLAIDMVSMEALEDKLDESVVLVADTFEYDVPGGFVYLEDILVEQSTAGRFSSSGDGIDTRWWRILRGGPNPRIWFDDAYFPITAGRKLRLIGQKSPAQMTVDDEKSTVDQSYVLYQAKANLHFARSEELNDQHHRSFVSAQSLAEAHKQRLRVAGRGARVAF